MMSNNYLSRQQTQCLKGIFALFVLNHHLYQYSNLLRNNIFGSILQLSGYLSVAMFFFLSGYGLQIQYLTKGKNYVHNFPRCKILPYFLTCCFSVLIYIIFRCCLGIIPSLKNIFSSLTYGGTVVGNGWFLQELLILYILYYFANLGDKTHFQEFIIIFISLIAYRFLYYWIESGSTTRYESIGAFALGIYWANNREKLDEYLQNLNYFIIIAVLFSLFSVTLIFGNTMILHYNFLRVICKMISADVFAVFCIAIIMRINFVCKVTHILGELSLEIYILQGIGLSLFHSEFCYIKNPYVYILSVIALTFVMSLLFRPIYKRISAYKGISLRS